VIGKRTFAMGCRLSHCDWIASKQIAIVRQNSCHGFTVGDTARRANFVLYRRCVGCPSKGAKLYSSGPSLSGERRLLHCFTLKDTLDG
jgi:hypothetical protein